MANINNLQSPAVHRAPRRSRKVTKNPYGSAHHALGELEPGCEIFGFTKGQFSLIDLVEAILAQTGPAHVTISTWTAAHADIQSAFRFLTRGDLLSCRWIVDRSFMSRQREYCELLVDHFGVESVRVTRTHAKFVLIRNEGWNIALRTSMNLNTNPRFENFEISDDPLLAGFLQEIVDEVFTRSEVGDVIAKNTPEVDEQFSLMWT